MTVKVNVVVKHMRLSVFLAKLVAISCWLLHLSPQRTESALYWVVEHTMKIEVLEK